MYTKLVAAAAILGLASAAPQAVTSDIAPQETAPAGCSPNYDGKFQIQILNLTSSKTKRQESVPLVNTLKNGVLTDNEGRTGYIASNNQFQYDKPPQAGAIYTAGFTVCQNGSLALGNSAVFYKCLSGTFYNLYDENASSQCSPVLIDVLPVNGQSTGGSSTVASQIPDGQVTANPVTQIGDGQVQAPTKVAVVTQIGDGQIQAPTGGVVTQISDGQVQAPTAVVTQIPDGQIQAPNGTVASPSVVPFTGAASTVQTSIFALVAGLAAVLAL